MYKQPTRSVLYQILSEQEALCLELSSKVSISVILIIPQLPKKGGPEVIIIDEYKRFDQTRKKKFPGGKMEEIDSTVLDAAKREMLEETGFILEDASVCFAGEFSSTIPGERHYKVYFLVKKYRSSGEPYKKDSGILSWEPIEGIEKVVIKNHQYCLYNCIESLKTWNREYAFALMNLNTKRFYEGE
ncbi:NUDIX domain-containing protein [Candidatus Nomurabacteria bacterium]|nr:NUDIX domain-containing protein [Candidatus Nomurabacteria bacterium]